MKTFKTKASAQLLYYWACFKSPLPAGSGYSRWQKNQCFWDV